MSKNKAVVNAPYHIHGQDHHHPRTPRNSFIRLNEVINPTVTTFSVNLLSQRC